MREITRIFIHCTAGNQNQTAEDVIDEFKRKGWKNPGYHYLILANGSVYELLEIDYIANGVKGYNSNSIHIAYTGGIDKQGNAIDNRTQEQKESLSKLIKKMLYYFPNAEVLGHRDISKDSNENGIIDPWERIKECPCFDVKSEYYK